MHDPNIHGDAIGALMKHPSEYRGSKDGAMPVYAGRSATPPGPSRSSASWAKLAATIAEAVGVSLIFVVCFVLPLIFAGA